MKARYAYPLLFLLPCAMLAALAAVLAAAAGAGLLWIFVYGDDPWPEAAGDVLMIAAGAVFVLGLSMFMGLGYSFGRRREARGGVRRAHVALAVGLSVALALLALLHQWQVGLLGAHSGPRSHSPVRTARRRSA